jgi:two-component system CheB/CheR fusion protein
MSSADDPGGTDLGDAPADAPADERGLDALLQHLQSTRGFDFHGYKRVSLARRIQRRMTLIGVDTYADYLDFLQVHPDEIPQLFNMVLINVTAFFRDAAAWVALAAHVEEILVRKGPDAPIRVWSAGAASGEEAYTLAMMFAELMGLEALGKRVKIYATDVDEDALQQARQATYSPRAVEGLSPELLAKYFSAQGSMHLLHKDLRRVVLFGRHNLLQDAPISRIDVLVCRNTLMYFNAEAQTRVLTHLHFALAPGGVLFLGKAEMLLTHLNLFTPLDLKVRLFMRAARAVRGRERPAVLEAARRAGDDEASERVWRAAFEAVPIASLVLDLAGRVVLTNRRATSLLGLQPHDHGRPFQDLEISYRPVDLRTLVEQARTTRRVTSIKAVERVLPSGERTFFDVEMAPLFGSTGRVLGTQISFADSTPVQNLHGELKKLGGELEAAHEELQSTSEELETINEELQSTVEELETTNEELQSTNEELETMNEELQSSNEELQTLNDELRLREVEVQRANSFLRGILGGLSCGVAVIDSDLLVSTWNYRMEDLWGLRADEVEGRHFLNLDIGLAVDDVRAPIRAALGEGEGAELTLDCVNRRGKTVRCRVMVRPITVEAGRGAILLVDEG